MGGGFLMGSSTHLETSCVRWVEQRLTGSMSDSSWSMSDWERMPASSGRSCRAISLNHQYCRLCHLAGSKAAIDELYGSLKSPSRPCSSLFEAFKELLFKSTPFAMTAKFARGQIAHILTSEGLLRSESESQRPADQTAGSFLILRSDPTCSKTERTRLPLTSCLKELENLRIEQVAAIPMVVLQLNSLRVTNCREAFLQHCPACSAALYDSISL